MRHSLRNLTSRDKHSRAWVWRTYSQYLDAFHWSLDKLSIHPNVIWHTKNEANFSLSKVTIGGVLRVKHQMNSAQNKTKMNAMAK